MQYKRMLVIEDGKHVIIRNSQGDEIKFNSLEELRKYTGVAIANKIYVGYEPEIDFFEDSEIASISNADIPNVEYEDLISNIALYQSRKDDPYYGITPEEARGLALERLNTRIITMRQEKNVADFEYLGVTYKSDEANILGVKAQIFGNDPSDPIPTFTGTAIASTWAGNDGAFTPFTCGTFNDFASFYYNHRSANFTNYTVLRIAAATAYASGATVEELEAMDITQGWD